MFEPGSARSWLIPLPDGSLDLRFANGTTAVQSFSAAFVLNIVSNYTGFSTRPHRGADHGQPVGRAHGQVPGWPGLTNAQDDDGNAAINHLLAVELDIV